MLINTLIPFPFCGHITSLESLWMGVPIITLEGQTPFGRVTGSFLSLLGLEDLIAKTREDYIQKATALAHNPTQLEYLRQTLRENLQNSPLCDGKKYMQDLESLYKQIWKQWCQQR